MKKIAIIGSGISGLVLGNLFKKRGLDFEIFDKRSELSINEGYGIQLSVNSIKILNTIGFKNFNNEKLFNPKKIIIKSINNQKEISNLNIDYFNIENEKYSCLKRSDLVKFLYEQIKEKIFFNKEIFKISKVNDRKIELEFYDKKEIFDFVIIATGLSFKLGEEIALRDNFFTEFNGYFAVRGTTDKDFDFIDNDNINLFFGGNSHLVTYSLNKTGKKNSIFVFKDHNKVDKFYYKWRYSKEGISFITEKLDRKLFQYNNQFKKLFGSEGNSFFWWPIYQSKSFSISNHKSLIYVGDALFKTLPTMAQGAGQAIESAHEINELFDFKGEFRDADYVEKRKKRINLINRRIKFNNLIFHTSNSLLINLRNIAIKLLVKNRFFLKFYLGKIYRN